MKKGKNSTTKFSIWKKIQIGTGLRTPRYFLAALEDNGCEWEWWGDDLLGYMKIAKQPQSINLVRVTGKQLGISGKELGLKEGLVTLDSVYAKALELGLQLCPAEVGPQLRLQYLNQPTGEALYVGMKPIMSSNEYPGIFVVERGAPSEKMSPFDSVCVESKTQSDNSVPSDSPKMLDGTYGMGERCWDANALWVFVKPRS